MNARNLIVQIAVCLASCTHHTEVSSPASAPAVNVTLTHISYGNISNDITLSASIAYLNKSVVTAPIAGYIVKVYVQVGDKVKAGQPLCELESKEQHTLASANVPSVIIRAGQEGVLLNVSQQTGDYVQEGTPLCTLGVESSFVFLLNVPYEASEYVMKGKRCTLVLPDNARLTATIGNPLASMNVVSQTQPVMAYADAPFLPEGMNVKAVIPTAGHGLKMILPKKAVQSNEEFTSYWVMKLADDSTAIRVPVKIGNSSADSIEIEGTLSPDDRIILTGGYALPDSSKIRISHE